MPSCSYAYTEPQCTTLVEGKVLGQINPTPKLVVSATKRAKSVATLLTSPKHIAFVKNRAAKQTKQTKKNISKKEISEKTVVRKTKRSPSPSSDEEEVIKVQYEKESDILSVIDETECTRCGENYNST
ncbi:hypothetical protein ILUMI_19397 [Ignelater luminosus]|uniref:Uncharacterized protein n=1 Tax=Ignelater luminosus TaxID=2038154 RepID=A0A8K0CJE1_IGNLU|nr:hypothetical protein ILUMI_19397 [Ignelater luminosus]